MLTDWATSSVKTDARGSSAGLHLLLALGIGAHAGNVTAGGHVVGLQYGAEGRGDRDDHIGLRHAIKIDRLERQTGLGRRRFDRPAVMSGLRFQPIDLLEGALFQRRAQLERGLVARADHAEDPCCRRGPDA